MLSSSFRQGVLGNAVMSSLALTWERIRETAKAPRDVTTGSVTPARAFHGDGSLLYEVSSQAQLQRRGFAAGHGARRLHAGSRGPGGAHQLKEGRGPWRPRRCLWRRKATAPGQDAAKPPPGFCRVPAQAHAQLLQRQQQQLCERHLGGQLRAPVSWAGARGARGQTSPGLELR